MVRVSASPDRESGDGVGAAYEANVGGGREEGSTEKGTHLGFI